MRTLAAILVKQKNPLLVTNISLPARLSFGQVLVQIHYSTICGSQLNEIDGAKGPDKYLPHLLGHEASGTVLSIGGGVSTVKKGDHVVLHWRKGAGIEALPAIYQWKGKKVNAGWVTTFQQYSVVSENRVTKIPHDFDFKLAPLLGCAVTTAAGVINNDAQVKIGQSVVVFGAGGVGLNIIQMANLVSAYPIVAIDLFEEKLTRARTFGATYTINSKRNKKFEKKVLEIVGDRGADVVIETTGNTRIIETAYTLTHPDGRTILVGVPKKDDRACIYTLPLHFKKILKGSHGGSSQPDIDIPKLVKLMKIGKLKLSGIITDEFPLEKINEGISLMREGIVGRVALRMGE